MKIDLIVGMFECSIVALAAFGEVTLNYMSVAHEHFVPGSGSFRHLKRGIKFFIGGGR